MIRDEALAKAIECAEKGYTEGYALGGMAAFARLGDLWLGIADRLPIVAPEPDASPVGDPFPPEVIGEVLGQDEDVVILPCGHRMNALLHRGRWLHPYSLDVCDSPPIEKAER
jgi:hypothetical protein